MGGDGRGPHPSHDHAPDDGCRDRRAAGPSDPDRRPVARRLRVVQLPRLRPRAGDHRRGPRIPRPSGARTRPGPGSSAIRGCIPQIEEEMTDAPRLRGRPRAADDHPHPHVGDPGPGRRRHDLPRRPRPQDDLRRRDVRGGARRHDRPFPARRSRPPGGAAGRHDVPVPAGDRDGRRQLDDRQRPGPAPILASSRTSIRRCSTWTMPTASA